MKQGQSTAAPHRRRKHSASLFTGVSGGLQPLFHSRIHAQTQGPRGVYRRDTAVRSLRSWNVNGRRRRETRRDETTRHGQSKEVSFLCLLALAFDEFSSIASSHVAPSSAVPPCHRAFTDSHLLQPAILTLTP